MEDMHAHDTTPFLWPDDPAAMAALGYEAWRLVAELGPIRDQEAIRRLITDVFPADNLDQSADLEIARTAVWKNLTRMPVAALLAARPSQMEPRGPDLDALRGWVILGCFHAIFRGEIAKSPWRFAARAAARICTDQGLAEVRLRVPHIDRTDLDAVITTLETWASAELVHGKKTSSQVQHILRELQKLRGGRTREVTPAERAGRRRILEMAAAVQGRIALPGAGDTAVVLGCSDFDFDGETLVSVEEAADIARPVSLIRLTDRDPDDVLEATDEVLELIEDLLDDGSGAILASRYLTREEARRLCAALRTDISCGAAAPGAALLAASLLTGRNMADLHALPAEPPPEAGRSWWAGLEGGGVALAFAPAVTDAPVPPQGGFALCLPDWLQGPLQAALAAASSDTLEAEAQSWLERRAEPRCRRLGRVAQALTAALEATCVDTALSGLICGTDIRHRPQCFYTRTNSAMLGRAWAGCLSDWFGETLPQPAVLRTGTRDIIGSRRVPPTPKITRIFGDLQTAWRQADARHRDRDPMAAVDLQNAFVFGVCAILQFATGRRPHGLAFPEFTQVMDQGPCPAVRVLDKGNRQVDDARWLPLPGIALRALAALRQQLNHAAEWGDLHDPDVARMARASLAGDASPLWLIAAGGPPEPLRAADFWAELAARQERNMFRHYWRTCFLKMGIPSHLADAWMGHGGWDSAPLLPTSGWSMDELRPIRDLIDATARNLRLAVPEPRRLIL